MALKDWGECVLTATHFINRMPTKLLKGKMPYEMLHDTPPSYSHLKVFGCLGFMTIAKQGRDKFQPRAKACVFMGYPFGQKGYKVMDLETNKFHVSRDVIFHERTFPFANPQSKPSLFKGNSYYYVEEDTSIAEHTAALENQMVEGEDSAQRPTAPSPQQRRYVITHNKPSYLQDYVCCSSSSKAEHFCLFTLTNMCIPDA